MKSSVVILERVVIVRLGNIAVVSQIPCKLQFLTGALRMLYAKLHQLPVALLKVMPLKRAATTKEKILDAQVVSMPEDPAAEEDLAVKIVGKVAKVVKADMLVDRVLAKDQEVREVKIVAKEVQDLDSVVMKIAKQASTMAAGLLELISLVQDKDLAKKVLVRVHQEVVQVKIEGLAVSQLPNLARNSRKAN